MANFKGLRGVTVLKTVADLELHSYGRESKPVEAPKAKKVKEPEPEPESEGEESVPNTESSDSEPEIKRTRRRRS